MLKISTDRFSQGLPDPQEASVACYCEGCGREIYEGEDVWLLNSGDIVHQDTGCLKAYMDAESMTVEEAMASD